MNKHPRRLKGGWMHPPLGGWKAWRLAFPKCKEFLPDIINHHKQSCAHQHGDVLHDGFAKVHVLQGLSRQGECQTIGNEIADDDVEGKL